MIVAERKPLEDIKEMIAGYKKILILGCGTCVTICWAGGEKEVALLSSQLKLASKKEGNELTILEDTIERQCEKELVEVLKDKVPQVDAVLSLACGIGVQTTAEMFPDIPVYPALKGSSTSLVSVFCRPLISVANFSSELEIIASVVVN